MQPISEATDTLNKLYIEVTSFLLAHTQPEYPATYKWVQTANVFVGMEDIETCTRKYIRVYAAIKPVKDEIDLDVIEAYFVQKAQQLNHTLANKALLEAVSMGFVSIEDFRDMCGLL